MYGSVRKSRGIPPTSTRGVIIDALWFSFQGVDGYLTIAECDRFLVPAASCTVKLIWDGETPG